jgi:hypothetical protein
MEETVSEIKETAGDDLRGIILANFEDSEWEIAYIREDAREEFPDENIEKIFQDFGIDSFSSKNSYYTPMGELSQIVRVFDDGMILARFNKKRSLIIGLDRSVNQLPPLIQITEECF